jgi:hypothetical protein
VITEKYKELEEDLKKVVERAGLRWGSSDRFGFRLGSGGHTVTIMGALSVEDFQTVAALLGLMQLERNSPRAEASEGSWTFLGEEEEAEEDSEEEEELPSDDLPEDEDGAPMEQEEHQQEGLGDWRFYEYCNCPSCRQFREERMAEAPEF